MSDGEIHAASCQETLDLEYSKTFTNKPWSQIPPIISFFKEATSSQL